MSPAQSSNTPTPPRRGPASASKKCSGPCGRTLPLSKFLPDKHRRSGRRSDCKDCYKQRRGPRGKEAQQARELERRLLELQDAYGLPSLSDVLSRALEEVRQIGVTGADFAEQVRVVRMAIFTHGCRTVDEMVDETRLSRWAVDRVVKKLVDEGVIETRDSYLLDADADEPGRPPVEYHPTNSPRGEVFTHILHRRAAEDDLL